MPNAEKSRRMSVGGGSTSALFIAIIILLQSLLANVAREHFHLVYLRK